MIESVLNKYAINQIAYIVDDLEGAALAHSELFGSGPFFYMDPMSPTKATLQGEDVTFTIQMAYGQFGDKQIELIKIIDGVNPYGLENGFHHFSIWVDDPETATEHFERLGYKPLFTMESGGGLNVAYYDCIDKWGHCIEFHRPIQGMWDMVAKAAQDWDGQRPYRKFGE